MTETIKAKLQSTSGLLSTPGLLSAPGVTLTDTYRYYGAKEALPLLIADTPLCHAVISLQGAQLLEFCTKNSAGVKLHPWLWLSPDATFEAGKPIRGGIPVCLPWFGVNRQHPHKPKHGFARYSPWQLKQVTRQTDRQVTEGGDALLVELGFRYSGEQPDLFATAFEATLRVRLSGSLELTLEIANTSPKAADFSWAFHSYLAVNDLASCSVSGLAGCSYLDNTMGLSRQRQAGDITFGTEVDRVFESTTAIQKIHTGHTLAIGGSHCPSCIVWNPGEIQAWQISDIGESYRNFICVERGAAFNDTLQLGAGESFTTTMAIRQEDN